MLRARAEARARAAEETCATLERQAMLGRYMLEMRHGLNNALTSLLGNSDLLLIEPGSLSAQARAQIETIRNMTLRIHEVMQRFSSLEKEMNVVAQQVERDSGKVPRLPPLAGRLKTETRNETKELRTEMILPWKDADVNWGELKFSRSAWGKTLCIS